MDFELFKDWLTLDNIMDLIREYRSFGPLPGILLPMLEAFLPFLPLVLFVMANASAFGLWLGFLYSWLGAVAGALLVFLLVRKYGQKRILRFLKKHKQVQRLMKWVEKHGFGPLFILLCFPFTPSAVVNIVAGLSNISMAQYMLAVLSGKIVMIFTISFVGYDIKSLVTQPIRTAIVALVIFILWYVGKIIEIKMNMSVEKDRGNKKQ
ncbi:TVP38/TMEM64 family protein [Cytobacillus oceanisediminis]|uniref:TVP38/TMEM64 family protein n=1 Tax=Cytobacillus TaxID=2675230 RepID=UPI00203D9631|nr:MULTISPECIES: TVP38/TMEM64 family protein [Cytobacillus]MBY0157072.1 TVP38/TMEM64 family protein [Cytobacillus firmus]MCM3392105.1 TVP38/TMEM64 family protein [Cytobacillus oceanisediminis]MCM3528515.1 TVP38/TMEM64 family protein [Cytobacillus oceanisediminis]UQX52249.1 TVP38/TMEM64 family protein [Cytobacillus pseudoceanisediminis]